MKGPAADDDVIEAHQHHRPGELRSGALRLLLATSGNNERGLEKKTLLVSTNRRGRARGS
eukprot:429012-Rhodomonas_salina.1